MQLKASMIWTSKSFFELPRQFWVVQKQIGRPNKFVSDAPKKIGRLKHLFARPKHFLDVQNICLDVQRTSDSSDESSDELQASDAKPHRSCAGAVKGIYNVKNFVCL